jgi:hypothetical protein
MSDKFRKCLCLDEMGLHIDPKQNCFYYLHGNNLKSLGFNFHKGLFSGGL